jgi:tetratricopeptide (TPR) repeat protein
MGFRFAEIVLYACIPFVLLIFGMMPPARAVVASTVFSWLFLPNISIAVPGLPDFSKTLATTLGTCLGILIFDSGRIRQFRPKWYDVPVFVWCFGNILTSLSNDLGLWDGLAQALKALLGWGLPYLIGRLYLADFEGLRECAMGIVIGGLVYAPLCIFEARMSPVLQYWIYGILSPYEPPRFGLGYRPSVFLGSGLMVGMWMTAATLCAYWLRASGAVRQILGFPFVWAVVILAATTVLTKAVGATMLMILGVVMLELVKRTKVSWIVLIIVFLPPAYITLRTTGFWSGQELIDLTVKYIPDRGSSIETRIVSEDHLIAKAKERPWLGWGGFGRNRIIDLRTGKDLFPTDGLWVIFFGIQGLVGLVSLTLTFILPLWLTYLRIPARLWPTPLVAPAAALAILLGLYMIDNLANAMPNPLYSIAIGGLTGLRVDTLFKSREERAKRLREADALREAGYPEKSEPLYRSALELYQADGEAAWKDPQALDEYAYGHEALAELRLASSADPRRLAEVQRHLACAVEAREAAAALCPDARPLRDRLATELANLGRVFAAEGRIQEAEWAWKRALDVRANLVREAPESPEYGKSLAEAQNDLAWLLASHRESRPGALDDAIRLAQGAVEQVPSEPGYWNTLGASLCHAGRFPEAVEALGQAVALGDGGTGFDHYFLSIAYVHLGANALAVESFERAETWSRIHKPDHPELTRLHHEAATLLSA